MRTVTRSSVLVSLLAALVASPLPAAARPPAVSAHTFTPPWSVSADYSHCDWPDATVVCSASSTGDRATGQMTARAELRPAGTLASATTRGIGEHGMLSSIRLRSAVRALRITYTIRASAQTLGDSSPLPATWSRVFVRATANHSACSVCETLVSRLIASSQPASDGVPAAVSDQTYSLVIEMRRGDGSDLPAGTLTVRPLLYTHVDSYAGRVMSSPGAASAVATAESVKVEPVS